MACGNEWPPKVPGGGLTRSSMHWAIFADVEETSWWRNSAVGVCAEATADARTAPPNHRTSQLARVPADHIGRCRSRENREGIHAHVFYREEQERARIVNEIASDCAISRQVLVHRPSG